MKSTKLFLKTFIIAYTWLRLIQVFIHVTLYYIKCGRILAPSTSYSITVAVCSLLLFFGVIYEYPVLLQSWMLWTVLQFFLMAFGVFDLKLETDTFLPNSQSINVAISSILQILTMVAVVKLTRIVDYMEETYVSEIEEAKPTEPAAKDVEEAVFLEPALFTSLLLH